MNPASDKAQGMVSALLESLVMMDTAGVIEVVNPETCSLLGYRDHELIGQPMTLILAQHSAADWLQSGLKTALEQGELRDMYWHYRTKTGTDIPVLFSCSLLQNSELQDTELQNAETQFTGLLGVARDLRSLEAANSLATSQNREQYTELKELIAAIRTGKVDSILGSASGPHIIRLFDQQMLEENERHREKEKALAVATATAAEAQKRAAELAAEVDERKRVEAQLVQAGKLAALGEIGTGIAHELNQPLTGILNFTRMALSDLEPNHSLTQDLTVIREQSLRMSDIIQKITTFARPQQLVVEAIDIGAVIDDALTLVSAQLKDHGIDVVRDFPDDLPQVLAVSNLLQQCFLNFFTNARDAIDALPGSPGGTLTIRGRVLQPTPGVSGEGARLEVIVTDSGVAVPDAIVDRLFEPFCTTKETGKGTGLGLSISHGIIRDMDGWLHYRQGDKGEKEFVMDLKATFDAV